MEWTSPFVIYRITSDGKLLPVYEAKDLKQAKYWLTYIAQPGDVLCKTPIHPKHSKQSSKPEYWAHKETSATPCSKETAWKTFAVAKNFSMTFPESPDDPAVVASRDPGPTAATTAPSTPDGASRDVATTPQTESREQGPADEH